MILHNIITKLYQPLCWYLINNFNARLDFNQTSARSFFTHLLHDDVSLEKFTDYESVIDLALQDEFPDET